MARPLVGPVVGPTTDGIRDFVTRQGVEGLINVNDKVLIYLTVSRGKVKVVFKYSKFAMFTRRLQQLHLHISLPACNTRIHFLALVCQAKQLSA